MNGGAFAYRMGNINNQAFRFWQVTFGFGLGNWLYTRKPSEIRHALIVASQGMLTVCSFLIVFWSYTPKILLIPFFIYFVIVTCSLVVPPEHKVFGWLLHFPFIIEMHQILNLNTFGGNPLPPQVYLSDGAHGENLALIPLLEQQYRTIIVCDGSEDISEQCENLLISIALARQKIGCSFIPLRAKQDPEALLNVSRMKGDFRASFIQPEPHQMLSNDMEMHSILNEDNYEVDNEKDIEMAINDFVNTPGMVSLRFQVVYTSPSNQQHPNASTVIYMKPRKQFATTVMGNTKNPNNSPMEYLHGCCCEVCHTPKMKWMNYCCGEFPQHSVLNQFFTPTLFNNYSELGYKTALHSFRST